MARLFAIFGESGTCQSDAEHWTVGIAYTSRQAADAHVASLEAEMARVRDLIGPYCYLSGDARDTAVSTFPVPKSIPTTIRQLDPKAVRITPDVSYSIEEVELIDG